MKKRSPKIGIYAFGGLLVLTMLTTFGFYFKPLQSTELSSVSWTTVAPCPYATSEAQGVSLQGKLYVFGGFDTSKPCCTPTDKAYRYDPISNTWTALANMPPNNNTLHGGLTHAGFTTDGTNIFFAGGYSSNLAGTGQRFGSRDVWRYNVAANTYTKLPKLPLHRAGGNLEYLNDKLHYVGGTNQERTMDVGTHYVLDLNNTSAGWDTLAPLPNPRHHAGSTVLNDKIFIVGGQHKHDEHLTTQDDVHYYDASNDVWVQVADLPAGRSHIASAAFVLNGEIIAIGGELDHGHEHFVNDVLAYNPATDTWRYVQQPLPVARTSGVSRAIDGIIYYTTGGGSNATYKGAVHDETTTLFRYEVESNYHIVQDLGTNAIKIGSWTEQSPRKGVRLPDLGDKIKIHFNTYSDTAEYVLRARVRSGNSNNSTSFFNKYAYKLDENSVVLTGDNASISAFNTAFGGSYFGTMQSTPITLTSGMHEISIEALRTGLVVDYLEVEKIETMSAMRQTQNPAKVQANSFKIFPNPVTQDKLFIQCPEAGWVKYTISNNTGAIQQSSEVHTTANRILTLPIADLPKGIYYLSIKQSQTSPTMQRFIKE